MGRKKTLDRLKTLVKRHKILLCYELLKTSHLNCVYSLGEWSARLPLDLGVVRTIPGGRKDKSLLEKVGLFQKSSPRHLACKSRVFKPATPSSVQKPSFKSSPRHLACSPLKHVKTILYARDESKSSVHVE